MSTTEERADYIAATQPAGSPTFAVRPGRMSLICDGVTGGVFFTASRPVTDGKNTGPVNRKHRSVYRDHQFCCVGFSGLPGGFITDPQR
jgi:hypothetical protein